MPGIRAVAAIGAGLLLASCAADTPGVRTPAAPAVTGAMLGPMLGDRRARAAAAGVAAVPAAGPYIDRLERDLRARTAGSGVEIVRRGGNLDLRMRSGTAFDFNASTVKSQFRRVLDDVAQTLATYQSTLIDIGGYTDSVGTDPVNLRLSEQRAAAVADYLARLGVGRARIATRGYGKAMPIASNADEAGRAQNRRVEIHVSPVVEDDLRGRRY